MSWGVVILNSKEPVDLESGSWPDFDREQTIAQIKKSFPDIDFSNSSVGVLENEKCDIEFDMGNEKDMCNYFMLHVRGNSDPKSEIVRMCKENGWIALDGESYITEETGKENFAQWSSYRDQVVNKQSKPWWKFW